MIDSFKAHSQPIRSMIRMNEDLLASCSDDKTVKIWKGNEIEVQNGSNSYSAIEYNDHSGPVNCLIQLAPNIIASSSADKTIKVRDIENKIVENYTDHTDCVYTLIGIDQYNFISGGSDSKIRLFDRRRGKYCNHSSITTSNKLRTLLKFNENEIICGDFNGFISIYDLRKYGNFIKEFKAHDQFVLSLLQVSENVFVSSSRDKKIKAWSRSGDKVENITTLNDHNDFIYDLCF
jgi:WD40 repeat protein